MGDAAHAGSVVGFYDTHPISQTQILQKLERQGVDLTTLTEDILQQHDQDHYGGLAANDALAAAAGLNDTTRVLDLCCGLGGPARYMAQHYGCRVTGVDLTQSRIDGARTLTDMTRQSDRVTFLCANALDLPLDDRSFDVVLSQEAFCHIPDKPRLIAECARVLVPGGLLAFTDILATRKTTDAVRERLEREMTFIDLQTDDQYAAELERCNCPPVRMDDLGTAWRDILIQRLAMYRSLKDQTVERFGQEHFDRWDSAYDFFVHQFETGQLSGGRFVGLKR